MAALLCLAGVFWMFAFIGAAALFVLLSFVLGAALDEVFRLFR